MKYIKIILAISCIILYATLFLTVSCTYVENDNDKNYELGYVAKEFQLKWHGDYDSNLTEEEHVARISNITKEIYMNSNVIDNGFNGEVVSYNVELIKCSKCFKSIYFLLEIELNNECYTCRCESHTTKCLHTIGYIENDSYYLGLENYCGKPVYIPEWNVPKETTYKNLADCFKMGKSSYSVTNIIGEKTIMFAGSTFYQSIYNEGEYICIANKNCYINEIMECHYKNKNHFEGECSIGNVFDNEKWESLSCSLNSAFKIEYKKC